MYDAAVWIQPVQLTVLSMNWSDFCLKKWEMGQINRINGHLLRLLPTADCFHPGGLLSCAPFDGLAHFYYVMAPWLVMPVRLFKHPSCQFY